jgi:hypothetical protein
MRGGSIDQVLRFSRFDLVSSKIWRIDPASLSMYPSATISSRTAWSERKRSEKPLLRSRLSEQPVCSCPRLLLHTMISFSSLRSSNRNIIHSFIHSCNVKSPSASGQRKRSRGMRCHRLAIPPKPLQPLSLLSSSFLRLRLRLPLPLRPNTSLLAPQNPLPNLILPCQLLHLPIAQPFQHPRRSGAHLHPALRTAHVAFVCLELVGAGVEESSHEEDCVLREREEGEGRLEEG